MRRASCRAVFDLSGHVAVFTGGNSGIGLGMAEGLARAGADVSIWGRTAERNAAARERLAAPGAPVQALRGGGAAAPGGGAAVCAAGAGPGRRGSGFAHAGAGSGGVAPPGL